MRHCRFLKIKPPHLGFFVQDFTTLKKCLDQLSAEYDRDYLDSDPVGIVHRYSSQADIETAGFIVSVLGYGNTSQIRKSAYNALSPAGDSPADFTVNLTKKKALRLFKGWKHRWTDAEDLFFLYSAVGSILREYGTIGAFVKRIDDPSEETIEGVMIRFSSQIRGRNREILKTNARRGISYLVPSPADGSACKRLAMYFRWMVRGPDGVDFGLWKFISPSRLVIPVDVHIARMGIHLGLTKRKSPDWKMALEITRALGFLDPEDPIRYDFALVRPGITRQCSGNDIRKHCSSCILNDICRDT
jgi:uncharacterized protein (TIGR02757 family)